KRSRFIVGLKDIDKYCLSNYQATFVNCCRRDKISVLEHFETYDSFSNHLLNRIKTKLFGLSFFENFKSLTVSGYCLSKLGATQGLVYDHIPGDYISCITLIEGQKSWATK